jgi:oligopeptide transport system substrate-binding protein
MNVIREPLTLDPRMGSDLIGSTMHFFLFEGLMRTNPDGSVIPAQARSVSISDDRKTYTFHLRGTFWSDGSPVTAMDFEKAWKKILTPDFIAANAHLLFPIKNAEKAKKGLIPIDEIGIAAADDQTLIVQLEHPTPYFLDLVSFCVFFPVPHLLDEADPQWMKEAGDHFISNGPFKLASWKHHNEIVFEKNPLYWEAPQIGLDKVQISMVANEATVLHMYQNGELDFLGLGLSPLPNDALSAYFKKGMLKTYSSPATTIVCFNVDKFPFNNINIRKAFAYAINRKSIVDNITMLSEHAATNLIPPNVKNHHNISFFKDHDVQKAREHFELGLKELNLTKAQFPLLKYAYSHGDLNHKLAQTLQQQWIEVLGVKVALDHTEHKILLDNLKTRSYDLAQSFWMAQYNNPMNILERFKWKSNAKNYPGWEHPEYIRLLDQANTSSSSEEMAQALNAAEALLMEEMPLTPLYHWKSAFMLKDHLSYEEFPANGFLELTRISFKDSFVE